RLLKNILINNTKNVKCFNLSIGNENKDYYLNINPLNDGGHSINTFEYYSDNNDSFSVDYICSLYGDEISQKTRIEKLDNFMKFLPKKFNNLIIKIDVEGYEKECIEGMRNIINTYKNLILIVEVSERNLNLIKSLENMSFDACMFTDKEISKIDRVNIRPGNYLFRKQ
ncbi:MAG: FkbM family methyltransferase, partial [Flavobacteriales bacterium]|nr:FkbM family methyltransferase [Flavobacteriales bacterium]